MRKMTKFPGFRDLAISGFSTTNLTTLSEKYIFSIILFIYNEIILLKINTQHNKREVSKIIFALSGVAPFNVVNSDSMSRKIAKINELKLKKQLN